MKIICCCEKLTNLISQKLIRVNFKNKTLTTELGADSMDGGTIVELTFCPCCGEKIVFSSEENDKPWNPTSDYVCDVCKNKQGENGAEVFVLSTSRHFQPFRYACKKCINKGLVPGYHIGDKE